MSIADLLLFLADRIAPSDRRDWLSAMTAEYEVMESGGLRWAAGCLLVAIGWRLASDGLYLALISASLWAQCNVQLVGAISRLEGQWLGVEALNLGAYPQPLNLAIMSLALGVYRPRLVSLTSILLVAGGQSYWLYAGYSWMTEASGHSAQTLWQYLQSVKICDAPLAIGLGALFGACLCGGFAGRWLASRIRNPIISRT